MPKTPHMHCNETQPSRGASASRKVSLAFWLLVLAALILSCRARPVKSITSSSTPQTARTIDPLLGFPPVVLGKPYPGSGTVKIVNRKEGWVEIDHGEIKDLMPAMEMEFWVRDSSLMDAVRVGDKVDFVVVEDSKGQYLTQLKKVTDDRR